MLGQDGGGGGLLQLLPFMVVVVVAFYFMIIRPGQREQNSRKQMLSALKKNDHVVTIGGLYGTVANVRPEIDEVTLKIDEATGTKIRVTMASISRVITGDETETKK